MCVPRPPLTSAIFLAHRMTGPALMALSEAQVWSLPIAFSRAVCLATITSFYLAHWQLRNLVPDAGDHRFLWQVIENLRNGVCYRHLDAFSILTRHLSTSTRPS
jgi:hypothetical protein